MMRGVHDKEAVKTISTCRSCGSKNLTFILSLGNQYVSNFIDFPMKEAIKIPLELVLCDMSSGGCGLLQLRHTTPPELMYQHYWYRSGINQTMRNALADISNNAEKVVDISAGDIVLDIGCNDGTLLRSYTIDGLKLVGFDPARNMLPYSTVDTTKIFNDFFNFKAFEKEFHNDKAKIITSIAMFYDLDEPNTFVEDIIKCLHENGVWIIQMSYLVSMLEQNAFDNICHEHLEYYSLTTLQNLLKRHDLEVFDVELNDVNGGSFRVYVKHKNCDSIHPLPGSEKRIKDLENSERVSGLQNRKIYNEFAARVNQLKTQLYNFIKNETQREKSVYVYGASTKGNTLLQFINLDHNLIKAAAERNSDKFGKKTVGTLIPIIPEEQARKENPDYMLVLPWHFIDEFKKREMTYLNSGGKFIVPLPEFKIISSKDLPLKE